MGGSVGGIKGGEPTGVAGVPDQDDVYRVTHPAC